MPAEPTKTEMPIKLVPQDLSTIGYIETAAYLKWVQAVVIKHWERFAPEAAQASTLWIAVRHVISHHAPGLAGDSLTASTWIKRSRGCVPFSSPRLAAATNGWRRREHMGLPR
jgi:acyl-CoA thioester hydrolase